jgi:heptaprenyl diphosphate synthase
VTILFAETFHGLAQVGDPRLVRAFAEAAMGLAAGELEQFRSSRGPVEVEAYLEHIRMKTAGFSGRPAWRVALWAASRSGR